MHICVPFTSVPIINAFRLYIFVKSSKNANNKDVTHLRSDEVGRALLDGHLIFEGVRHLVSVPL